MIEVLPNQSRLHAATLLSVDPSCRDRAMANGRVHCRGDLLFCLRRPLFLSTACHFIGVIEKLVKSSLAQTRLQLPARSAQYDTEFHLARACSSVPADSPPRSARVHHLCFSSPSVFALTGCNSNVIVPFFCRRFQRHSSFSREWLHVLLRVCHTFCVSSKTFLCPAAPPAFARLRPRRLSCGVLLDASLWCA